MFIGIVSVFINIVCKQMDLEIQQEETTAQ